MRKASGPPSAGANPTIPGDSIGSGRQFSHYRAKGPVLCMADYASSARREPEKGPALQ